MSSTAYDFSFKSIKGEDMIDLSDFKDKVMVVVNTASDCGFTNQYKGLQTLHNLNEDLVVSRNSLECLQVCKFFNRQETSG